MKQLEANRELLPSRQPNRLGLPGRRDNKIDHGIELGMWRVFRYEVAGSRDHCHGWARWKKSRPRPREGNRYRRHCLSCHHLSIKTNGHGQNPSALAVAVASQTGVMGFHSPPRFPVGYLGERPPQMPFWDPGVDFGTEPQGRLLSRERIIGAQMVFVSARTILTSRINLGETCATAQVAEMRGRMDAKEPHACNKKTSSNDTPCFTLTTWPCQFRGSDLVKGRLLRSDKRIICTICCATLTKTSKMVSSLKHQRDMAYQARLSIFPTHKTALEELHIVRKIATLVEFNCIDFV